MSQEGSRSYLAIAAAIVVAGVLISASLFLAIGTGTKTTTETSTSTITSTTTSGATGLGYPISDTATTTTTATVTFPGTITRTTTVTQNSDDFYSAVQGGLLLMATVDPQITYGQNVTVSTSVIDILSTSVQLNSAGLPNPAEGPCQSSESTGVNVYSGHYTSANISQAVALQLYNPTAVYSCPTESTYQFLFGPLQPLNEESLLTGEWTSSGGFQSFPPGEYTFAAFDIADQTAIGYFQVAGPVQVVSVIGPISPVNPGGPVVGITIENVGAVPITSLEATLAVENFENGDTGYQFLFNVNSTSPLSGGQITQTTRTLIGAGIESEQIYPLTVTGTFPNGAPFSYTIQVDITPSG